MYAWFSYFVLILLSYYWFVTPSQAFYFIEIGAHILFLRKAGVYIIRISRKFIQSIQNGIKKARVYY